jgi:AraC-like DNA-binding protein
MLSALGSINGFIVALYLWVQPSKNLGNRFLAAMLVMISVRTIKSVLFYFNPEIIKPVLQVGLSACFLIGPLLYFFCLSQLDQLKSQKLRWEYHLTFLVSVILLVGLFYPYQQNVTLWGDTLYRLINYIWLAYILLSLAVISPRIQAVSTDLQLKQNDIWLFTIFIGNALIWLAYYTASYTSYIVGALSFSFILLIVCLLVAFKIKNKVTKEKYIDKSIDKNEADELINQLNELMNSEELYKNSVITMPQIAKRLGMSTPRFSQLLNDNLNKSFPVFINEFRIEAAKVMILSDKKQTLETISEQCGFNSQSTFYNAFKKQTNLTPAKYKLKNSSVL